MRQATGALRHGLLDPSFTFGWQFWSSFAALLWFDCVKFATEPIDAITGCVYDVRPSMWRVSPAPWRSAMGRSTYGQIVAACARDRPAWMLLPRS